MTIHLIFDFILGLGFGLAAQRWWYWRKEAMEWKKLTIEFNAMIHTGMASITAMICAPPGMGNPAQGDNIVPFKKPEGPRPL